MISVCIATILYFDHCAFNEDYSGLNFYTMEKGGELKKLLQVPV